MPRHAQVPQLPTDGDYQMVIEDARIGGLTQEGYHAVTLVSNRGEVECRFYPAGETRKGALFVGGAGGGWDTPVKGILYPRLCEGLTSDGVACLRVKYRHPAVLEESTLDVLAGVSFLESLDIDAMALVGHSFGGAVVLQAAEYAPTVRTVLPLSTQSYGAEAAATLGPSCSIFLFHGKEDEVLPPACSEYVYQIAREPKKITIYPGGRHGLDEAVGELPDLARRWIVSELDRAMAPSVTGA